MLLDSNIIIYASKPECAFLKPLLGDDRTVVSGISYPEVLGFTELTVQDKTDFEEFFATTPVLPVGEDVLHRAAELRQSRKMKLGDAIVAATALIHRVTLATRNISDFSWIPELALSNPFDQPSTPGSMQT